MTSRRRIGAETSKTRDLLLDCVERLMVKSGHASVTYRAVAAAAGVTSGLVQYYFPNHDDLFLAVIRRRSEQNVERMTEVLRSGEGQLLQALWAYSQDESVSTLTTEFLALGNHRASIRSEIAEITERVRRAQLEALHAAFGDQLIDLGPLPLEAFLFLLTGTPRLIRLEKGVGVSTTHAEALMAFENLLDGAKPYSEKPNQRTKK
jgi:TetR/AcrR family transcriptional regulator, transcriptional repressor for nem operon